MSEDTSPFHRGERAVQSRLGTREKMEKLGAKVIRDYMPEQHREFFSQLPLLFVGTVDAAGRPWASVLAGPPGFVRAADCRTLEVGARPLHGDPLNEALVEGADIGALGIEFHSRRRNRVNGHIARAEGAGFEIRVAQSYGNCPKYIQARALVPGADVGCVGEPRPLRRANALDRGGAALIARSDTLFIASRFSEGRRHPSRGVDVSHRGGRPGFVIVAHETSLVFPDYRGNGMFNTLGNIEVNPGAGLLFVDFESGDTLQLSGEAEVIWDPDRAREFPGAERLVSFRIDETLYIEGGLPLSWEFQGTSPEFDSFETATAEAPLDEAQPAMTLRSVNVSMPKEVVHRGKTVTTGIFKEPVAGRVMLRRLNLDGDGQADLWGHGGSFRAVYVYSIENYAYWERELGRSDFVVGQFGENFTVEGMLDDEVCVGDVFRVGGAVVEVSQPRVPCYKLGLRMAIEGFHKRFLESGRLGFYFRVLEEGEVGAGDTFQRLERGPGRMTVRQVNDLLYFDRENLEASAEALRIPALSHGWKGSFRERLDKAGAEAEVRQGFRRFRVERKVAESETITSFYLVPEDGSPLADFQPGQFLTFEVDVPGQPKPIIRTYSLSDSPNPDHYRVSIKREPAPALSSNYFHDAVEVGTTLCVGPPRGKFHLDPDNQGPVLLLSAGVGLTPMVSMLNAIVDSRSGRPVWFVHGARNGREHAMGTHVRRLARDNDNVRVHVRYSQPDPDDVEGRDHDAQGRVEMALLARLLPLESVDVYLCGPTPFMKSLYGGLVAAGVPESRLHYEFFGPASALREGPAAAPRQGSAGAEAGGQVSVTFARAGVRASWDPAFDNLLDFAESQGLDPDFSCRSGICRTCMCALVEGEVDYVEEPLEAPESGSVLICSARPRTDVVIDI